MRYNFLLCGQSNMSGRGLVSDLTGNEYPNAANIKLYGNDYVWKAASDPLDDPTGQVDARSADTGTGTSAVGVGPGMAFAERLLAAHLSAGDEVGLIPCAKGSEFVTAFRRFWTPDALYGSAIKRAYSAEAAAGVPCVMAGILWWQGEAESTDNAKALGWRESFSQIMADMRVDLGNLQLPVAFVRLNNLNPSGHPYWNTVRAQQESIWMKNVVMVSCDGLAGAAWKADEVHCTTAGYLQMGARFADAIAPLLAL